MFMHPKNPIFKINEIKNGTFSRLILNRTLNFKDFYVLLIIKMRIYSVFNFLNTKKIKYLRIY